MVNTRRSESIGSVPDIKPPHRTRKPVIERDGDSSSVSESEESQSEDATWDSSTKSKPISNEPLGPRVRELRSRFVHNQRKHASSLRSSSPRKRHSLSVYTRNMHNGADLYNGNDSDNDDVFARKSRRSRHPRQLDRMERRTALSLRPIRQKCYADSNSDSDLRRSKRQRNVKFDPISWLADDQMHIVGYPNLNTGYSEEDSRDAAETHIEEARRSTRHSERREIKNPKYLYDYQTAKVSPRRRRAVPQRNQREEEDEEDDYDDSIEVATKEEPKGEESSVNESVQENGLDANNEEEKEASDKKNNENDKGEEKKEESSESDIIGRMRTRTKTNNIIMEDSYTRRAKPRKRFQDSSSSESEGPRKGYSLRNRAPKAPISMKSSVLRNHELNSRSRKHFTRRRKVSSSSSTSSSDSEVRQKKPPKSPHSKNDQKMKSGAGGSKIIPIGPETLDTKVRFSSIGGLDGHIQCLKEMILLPMMYPEVFKQFQIQPPRGVLFHGPPGTGKTLIARALANECSFGCRKVSFFMRKGADLLSKWIGESEKQLRLLFEQASEMSPSIIFFDELDGLAPVRSSRQDQVHASIVSTLLALMDGLDNRGEVIVVGATNRIDAIDPALRRPGRFDRELFFPLPAKKEREAILKVHVSQWSVPPHDSLLSYLAETAVGYCGSDLRALCSEAVIQGFRRTYPQVYNADYRLMLNPENVKVEKVDFLRAKSLLVPASHRVTQGLGRKLMAILEPLLSEAVDGVFKMLEQTFPHALNPALSKVKLSPNIRPAQLLILGENADCGQTLHLAPAVLYQMEHIHAYILDLATLFRETGRSAEETCIQVFNEARRNVPSVIYIPNIDNWWSLVSETVKAILESQLSQLDPNMPILLLATADTNYENLPDEVQIIFSRYRKEVFKLEIPTANHRKSFFKPLLIDLCLKPPRPVREKPKTPPPLPRARTPSPSPLTEEQAKKIYEQEEHTLRELRIFLRDICKKLANNKLFYMFTKPVDTEEVPDYTTIIKQPMDLETMMTKVDFHRYVCAKDFLNDIELICRNALEYNPAKTSADKQIRHRACSLRDYAYTLIKNEMDSDFEDKCQDIAKQRQVRKVSVQKFLPAYIQTPDDPAVDIKENGEITVDDHDKPPELVKQTVDKPKNDEKSESKLNSSSSSSRKRKISGWQKGNLKKRKKKDKNCDMDESAHQDEDKKDSTDDSKDNSGNSEPPVLTKNEEEVSLEPTVPLTINCEENNKAESVNKRRLSDLMSPSELLENRLEFDDIDQALNEEVDEAVSLTPVVCSKNELETILEHCVQITNGSSLQSLLDLYNQLSRIIKKFSNLHAREQLPKELMKELTRFKNEASLESVSEGSPTSNHS